MLPSFFIPKNGLRIGGYTIIYPGYKHFLNIEANAKTEHALAPQIAYLEKIIDSTDLSKIVID